jgi:hypothetical protein
VLLLVNVAGATAMLALSQASFLLWPLVAISMLGVVGLMSLMNTSIVTVLAGKANAYSGWRDLLRPGLIGLALALVEFTLIGALRVGVL